MAYFNYRAIDENSNIVTGKILASNENELEDLLNSKGLTLIEAVKSPFNIRFKQGFREKDLLDFTYLLNVILTSGIPLLSGLSDIAKQSSNKRLSSVVPSLQTKISSGKSISDSMLELPDFFPPFYVSMVKAGEISGKMEQVLNDIMVYLEWQIKLKKEVHSALAYPTIILTAVIMLIVILFVFVMPKLLKIVTDLNIELPLPTRILAFIVGIIKGYWPLIIFIILSLPITYKIIYATEAGRRVIDKWSLKIPIIGELIRKTQYSRYFRTFTTLFRSGLDMSETLRVSASVVKNTFIADLLHKVTNTVIEGEQYSSALRSSGVFPNLLINMVEIGEKTGTLDNALLRVCDMYDREIPETIKKIFTIFEPTIIVLLGGLVLLTLASFFMALYKIVGGIR